MDESTPSTPGKIVLNLGVEDANIEELTETGELRADWPDIIPTPDDQPNVSIELRLKYVDEGDDDSNPHRIDDTLE